MYMTIFLLFSIQLVAMVTPSPCLSLSSTYIVPYMPYAVANSDNVCVYSHFITATMKLFLKLFFFDVSEMSNYIVYVGAQ